MTTRPQAEEPMDMWAYMRLQEQERGSKGVEPPAGLVVSNPLGETIPVPGKGLPTPQVASIGETIQAETIDEKPDTHACPPPHPALPLNPDGEPEQSDRPTKTAPRPRPKERTGRSKGSVQIRLRVPRDMALSLRQIKPNPRQRLLSGFWMAFHEMDIGKFAASQTEIRKIGINVNQCLVIYRNHPAPENNQNLITELGKLADFLEALGGGR